MELHSIKPNNKSVLNILPHLFTRNYVLYLFTHLPQSMAANIVPEEVAPLLEKEDLESDAVAKGPEIQVDATTVSSGDSVGPTRERRACDFLIRRSTYYCK